MDAKRLEDLLAEIWGYAFAIFEREPKLTREDAEILATAAEDAARRAALTLTFGFGSTTVEAAAGR